MALNAERQSARMSKITNDGLARSAWHMMLYSCTHMTTVGVKGLKNITGNKNKPCDKHKSTSSSLELALMEVTSRPSRMPRFISSSSRTSVTLIVLFTFTRMCMKTCLNVLDSSSSCRHSTTFLSGRKKSIKCSNLFHKKYSTAP